MSCWIQIDNVRTYLLFTQVCRYPLQTSNMNFTLGKTVMQSKTRIVQTAHGSAKPKRNSCTWKAVAVLRLLSTTANYRRTAVKWRKNIGRIDWLSWGFTSHPTQNTSFRKRSSQSISWLSTEKLKQTKVYLHALKCWRDGQLNLAHSTETKKLGKLKTNTK